MTAALLVVAIARPSHGAQLMLRPVLRATRNSDHSLDLEQCANRNLWQSFALPVSGRLSVKLKGKLEPKQLEPKLLRIYTYIYIYNCFFFCCATQAQVWRSGDWVHLVTVRRQRYRRKEEAFVATCSAAACLRNVDFRHTVFFSFVFSVLLLFFILCLFHLLFSTFFCVFMFSFLCVLLFCSFIFVDMQRRKEKNKNYSRKNKEKEKNRKLQKCTTRLAKSHVQTCSPSSIGPQPQVRAC